jgi:hypothetical protein
MWHGTGIVAATWAGVAAGGALNFILNVPAIWRTWGSPPMSGAQSTRA